MNINELDLITVRGDLDIILLQSTRMFSLISGEALAGQRLRASTSCICGPGLYLMVTSNLCNCKSIRWRRGGALAKFFMAIISNGLWSLSVTKLLPKRYVLNRWHANTMARSSLSMLAYQLSAPVRDLEAKAIGWLSCTRQAPRPLRLASA